MKPVVDELVHEAMGKYVAEMEERLKGQDARIAEQEARLSEQAKEIMGYANLLAKHDRRMEGHDELIGIIAGDIQQLTKKVDEFEDWIWERFMNFKDSTRDSSLRMMQSLIILSMTMSMRLMS